LIIELVGIKFSFVKKTLEVNIMKKVKNTLPTKEARLMYKRVKRNRSKAVRIGLWYLLATVVLAALAVLQSALGFNEELLGLMIAVYIAMDSVGTATNVTGDGAVTVIVDRIDSLLNRNKSVA
jgi:hypothetical protein